jgi:hypothetical protein
MKQGQAQNCVSTTKPITLGTASNGLTMLRGNTNQVIYNKDLDAIIFIHRNNATNMGGTSGHLRIDYSKDGGQTWQINDTFLNPANNSTAASRYPQVSFYNPAGNTIADSGYVVYAAPTVNGVWNGYNMGVKQFYPNAIPTENYISNAVIPNTFIPAGLCQGAPGTFWSLDMMDSTPDAGFRVFKGQWSDLNKDIIWGVNKEFRPSFNDPNAPVIADYNMSFDPTGRYGWVVAMSHLSATTPRVYPVFWMTSDSGATWSDAMEVNENELYGLFPGSGFTAAAGFEVDIVVDSLGHPHAFMLLTSRSVFPGTAYTIPNTKPALSMYDVSYDGFAWHASKVDDLNNFRGAYTGWTRDVKPQVGTTSTGSKVFFSWLESDSAAAMTNLNPRLRARAYDVNTGCWTDIHSFTGCSNYTDTVFTMSMSPIIRDSADKYDLPIVAMRVNQGDINAPANFYYVGGATLHNSDFNMINATIGMERGDRRACANTGIKLRAYPDNATSYAWSDGSTKQDITVTTAGWYYVTVTNGCGSSTTDSIEIFPSALPVKIDFGFSNHLCLNSTIDLVVNAAGKYSWSTSATDTLNQITVSQAGWYKINVDDGCGVGEDSVEIIAPSSSTITSSKALSICQGDTVVLDAGAGFISYAWSNTIDVTQTMEAITGGDYFCEITDSFGCTFNSDTVTVIIKSAPNPKLQVSNVGFCPGDSVMIQTGSGATYSYQWSDGGNAINGATDSIYYASAVGSYSVAVTDGVTGCTTTTGTFSIASFPAPSLVLTNNGNSQFCGNDSTSLSVTSSEVGTWEWYLNSTIINGATTDQLVVKTGGNYTVKAITNKGCTDTANINITVDPIPDTTLTVNGNTTFCEGDTVGFSVPYSSGNTYQWFSTGSFSIAGATLSYYTANGTTDDDFWVEITTPIGCVAKSSVIPVKVNPTPIANIQSPSNTTGCEGDSIRLDIDFIISGNTYQWTRNDTAISGATDTFFIAKFIGDYRIVVTNSFGCPGTSSAIQLLINPSPDPKITSTTSPTICQNDSVELTVTTSSSTASVQWRLNGTDISGATNPAYVATAAGTYTVYALGTNGCGGVSSGLTVTVNPLPTVTITRNATVLQSTQGAGYQWYKVTSGVGTAIPGETGQNFTPTTDGDYYVVMTDANGCDGKSANYYVSWIGFNLPAQVRAFNVYPNPSNGDFNVYVENSSAINFQIRLTDVTGRVIYTRNVGKAGIYNEVLNMKEYSSGIYMLTLSTATEQTVIKLIKQ